MGISKKKLKKQTKITSEEIQDTIEQVHKDKAEKEKAE